MQLVAYGAQDVYLTGNAQITFFKGVYRRHTNFSVESIAQTFIGSANFGKKVTCSLSRNGDLVSNCCLEVTLPMLKGKEWTDDQADGNVYGIYKAGFAPVTTLQISNGSAWAAVNTSNVSGAFNVTGTALPSSLSVSNVSAVAHMLYPAVVSKARADKGGTQPTPSEIISALKTQAKKNEDDNLFIGTDGNVYAYLRNWLSEPIGKTAWTTNSWNPDDDERFNGYLYKGATSHASLDHSNTMNAYWDSTDKCWRRGVRWIDNLGHYLIDTIEVDIGGQRMDSQTGEWLHLWDQLTRDSSKDGTQVGYGSGYNRMIGNVEKMTKIQGVCPSMRLYIPLRFWFAETGCALPLLALQYHEVKISTTFAQIQDLVLMESDFDYRDFTTQELTRESTLSKAKVSVDYQWSGDFNAELFCDYIYLDNEERRRFAQEHHEYLIPQIQFTGNETISESSNQGRFRLNFNHPVKELVFCAHNQKFLQPSNYSSSERVEDAENPIANAKLMLNGHDRFSSREGEYFDCVEPYQHHTRCPSRGICVYSFSLKPEQHQPSGTCNFSRIDNAQLELELTKASRGTAHTISIYAVNYNLLRIMSGLGGLAYSN